MTADGIADKHTNGELYEKQMALLGTFLRHGAITEAQYKKSSHDLTVKMMNKSAEDTDSEREKKQ